MQSYKMKTFMACIFTEYSLYLIIDIVSESDHDTPPSSSAEPTSHQSVGK